MTPWNGGEGVRHDGSGSISSCWSRDRSCVKGWHGHEEQITALMRRTGELDWELQRGMKIKRKGQVEKDEQNTDGRLRVLCQKEEWGVDSKGVWVLHALKRELLPEMQEGLGQETLALYCGSSKAILTVTWFGSGHRVQTSRPLSSSSHSSQMNSFLLTFFSTAMHWGKTEWQGITVKEIEVAAWSKPLVQLHHTSLWAFHTPSHKKSSAIKPNHLKH